MYVQYVHTIVDIVILNGKAMNQDIGKNVQIVVTKQLRKNMEQMEENMNTATCTKSGYKQYVCLECGDIYDREFSPALGHNYETKSNSTYHWKECTRCDSDTYDNKEKHVYIWND